MALDLEPGDAEVHYSSGGIDWTVCYQRRNEVREKLGMYPDHSLPATNKGVSCIKEKNIVDVEEGIDNLNKTLKVLLIKATKRLMWT